MLGVLACAHVELHAQVDAFRLVEAQQALLAGAAGIRVLAGAAGDRAADRLLDVGQLVALADPCSSPVLMEV